MFGNDRRGTSSTERRWARRRVEGEVREPMTDEEMREFHQRLGVLGQEMKSTGIRVFSGRLHEPATATVVRMAAGEPVTTEGPFVESEEHFGGFSVIQAPDSTRPRDWASRVTDATKRPMEAVMLARREGLEPPTARSVDKAISLGKGARRSRRVQ